MGEVGFSGRWSEAGCTSGSVRPMSDPYRGAPGLGGIVPPADAKPSLADWACSGDAVAIVLQLEDAGVITVAEARAMLPFSIPEG